MRRLLLIITISTFGLFVVSPPGTAAAEGGNDVAERFEGVMVLKSRGDYEGAARELDAIKAEFAGDDRVTRMAYGYLVAVWLEAGDSEAAERAAAEALEKFPDITTRDEITIPPLVADYFDELRREMYGALSIVEPKDCDVFLDGTLVGRSPMEITLVRAGEHTLVLVKEGHHDYTKSIVIEPDRIRIETIEMRRARTRAWWIKAGAVVAVGIVAAIVLWPRGEDDLSEPPGAP